jgi:ubiquitin C-terminal hydrolase
MRELLDEYKVGKRKFNFDDVVERGKVGLENNVGYTCYVNAALQCVLSVEVLNRYFCANEHIK